MFVIVVDPWALVVGAAVLLAGVGIWTYRLARGVTFRPGYAAAMIVLYLLLFLGAVTGNWLGANGNLGWDVVLLAGATAASGAYTYSASRVAPAARGGVTHVGGTLVPAVWLLLFLLEIVVQVELFGGVSIFQTVVLRGLPAPPEPGVPLPFSVAALALALVDGLFALSTGWIVGHYGGVFARVMRQHLALGRGVPG